MPELTEQQAAFYELASIGVWGGVAVACLVALLCGVYFGKAMF